MGFQGTRGGVGLRACGQVLHKAMQSGVERCREAGIVGGRLIWDFTSGDFSFLSR